MIANMKNIIAMHKQHAEPFENLLFSLTLLGLFSSVGFCAYFSVLSYTSQSLIATQNDLMIHTNISSSANNDTMLDGLVLNMFGIP